MSFRQPFIDFNDYIWVVNCNMSYWTCAGRNINTIVRNANSLEKKKYIPLYHVTPEILFEASVQKQ